VRVRNKKEEKKTEAVSELKGKTRNSFPSDSVDDSRSTMRHVSYILKVRVASLTTSGFLLLIIFSLKDDRVEESLKGRGLKLEIRAL